MLDWIILNRGKGFINIDAYGCIIYNLKEVNIIRVSTYRFKEFLDFFVFT